MGFVPLIKGLGGLSTQRLRSARRSRKAHGTAAADVLAWSEAQRDGDGVMIFINALLMRRTSWTGTTSFYNDDEMCRERQLTE